MITYDDFAKLEIMIGEIKTVEVVEDADKLLTLTVDFGEKSEDGQPQHRQIISGIREYFDDPHTLVGTKCPFVTNLQPRVIRGLKSQGMILAVGGKTFSLLTADDGVAAGARIQ